MGLISRRIEWLRFCDVITRFENGSSWREFEFSSVAIEFGTKKSVPILRQKEL